MEIDKIVDKVIDILHYKLEVPKEKLVRENECVPLTGQLFQFTAIEMAYLYLEVEKEFDCIIGISQIKAYGFNTIRGISEVIKEVMKKDTNKKNNY